MASIETRNTSTGERRYRVSWRQNGAKRSRTFTQLKDAKRFRGEVDVAGQIDPFDGITLDCNLTLTEWGPRAIAARTTLGAYQRKRAHQTFKRWIQPQLGHHHLSALTPELAGRWLVWLSNQPGRPDKPLSYKSQKNILGLSSSIFTDAIRNRLVAENPFAGLSAIKTSTNVASEAVFLTPAEYRQLHAELPEDDYADAIETLAATGGRLGEITALQDEHVDLDRLTIRICQAWKADGSLGAPKTKSSIRIVPIDERLGEILERLLRQRRPGELLFQSSTGRRISQNLIYRRRWVPLRELGVIEKRPRIHDLRHSHASWLIAAGVPLPVIQRRLGHSSITTTIDRYGHLLPELDNGVRDALTQALG